MLLLFDSLSDVDINKFTELFSLYEKPLYSLAMSILKDSHAAEDVMQIAFIKILNHLDQVEDCRSQSTKAFVKIILKRSALDYLNKEKKMIVCGSIPERVLTEEECFNLDRTIGEFEFSDEIEKYTSQMKFSDREIFVLKFAWDMTDAQIAEHYGISIEAANKRWLRAKERFVNLINKRKAGEKHE